MLKFVNEGNGMEGIIETAEINKEKSKQIKTAIIDKGLVWDPVFEQFIEKQYTTELEKGTVTLKKTLD